MARQAAAAVEMTKDLKLAFIKPTAAVLASPREFKPYGQCGMRVLRLSAAHIARWPTTSAWSAPCTRTHSITIRASCCCSPARCSSGVRRWAPG